MDKLKKLKELTELLHKASVAYYQYDNPIMSDKQYDDLYEELEMLEEEISVILAGSPTQNVQGYILKGLEKQKHSKPMLSANKTKDVSEIKKFIGNKKCIMSWKEDGLTIVLRFKNGKFVQAITRGTSDIGEDVTHTMKTCKNIPLQIPYCEDIEVRGECLISWKEFDRINEKLTDKYKHPRNLAAGSVRQLDANVTKGRNIIFKAFELVQDDLYNEKKYEQLMDIKESFDYLAECGFDVVEHEIVTCENVEEMINKFNPEEYEFPVDGLIFSYDDYLYGKSLGETSKFPLNMIALKWQDDLYETTLRDIEWGTSRTGLINPVAIFDEIDLDGALTTKATLHNVSFIEDLELGIGDTIQVYRSNKVIPKVHDNLTRSNTYDMPTKCPCCGAPAEARCEKESKMLFCTNPDCSAKFTSKLANFVSRNGMNIVGLSTQTLELLVDKEYVTCFKDLYHLEDYKKELSSLSGFGAKSVSKLLKAIEDSKKVDLTHFLTALGIPLCGKSTCKDIAAYCHGSIDEFIFIINNTSLEFMNIDKFGNVMFDSLLNWWEENAEMVFELLEEVEIIVPEEKTETTTGSDLDGATFCITGKLTHFANRDTLVESITAHNGKYLSGVSSKLNYLINNDKTSTSGKNKKALEVGCKIISESDYLAMIGRN